ncbi:MAG: bifunctional salicylyl-CoA 5-hydroxylase/oxidoreductase [Candidatus Odyssella sp.]|nr:bifunctional salicylyl-CoA 5-hydroxylase/oxidoreductase [Candidatus Odyssella sp.]
MKINCLGGGPGSMYFATLMKKSYPGAEINIYEQNKNDDTFGFGVVFSDKTMEGFRAADEPTYHAITGAFEHWDDIDIYAKGKVLKSTGHGFAGMSRVKMLILMQKRCQELGIKMHFQTRMEPDALRDCDLLFAADGVNSVTRERYKDKFLPNIDFRPNRFVWLGTDFNFPAFTFHFIENEHGLWRTHCYRYEEGMSTLIIECTDETFLKTGLGVTDEAATAKYIAKLLEKYIPGGKVITNRSHWRNFPNITCGNWQFDNVVLAGDAVHTAHFSIGSGTKLAMEDAIALHKAITETGSIKAGLPQYVKDYKPQVESLQRAANVSQRWFEEAERYYHHLDPMQFGFALLTRSLRISHGNLRQRDEKYVGSVDRWFASQAANQSGVNVRTEPAPPPMFTPFRLRDLVLPNRIVVSPMCQYSAEDGMPDDWHLVHIGSRAMGGAGLIIAEMTDVSREGRISPGCTGMYKPEHVKGWKRVTDFVHKHSQSKIALQLGHAGRKGSTRLLWEGYDEPLKDGNWPILAASPLPYKPHSQVPREMTRADMDAVIADYVRATKMAEEAGFDMLEVHMAHGYLLNTFISPLTNKRKDDYGGSLANRMRFPLEVYRAVRAAWPSGKPISVRISAHDWKEGGTEPKDAVEIAKLLKAAGVDIVDVSSGQVVSDEKPVYGRLFQTPFADRIRLELGMPTMAVGGISSYEDVNSILAAGRADLCVIARAHLFDPYWTRHAAYELGWIGADKLAWPKQYDTLNRNYVWRFETAKE